MAELLLVRHAVTGDNRLNRFWGSTDVPLSPEGIRQAERLRERLAEKNIDRIYTSALSRCRVTADIIAQGHGADVECVPELNECDFGDAGLTFDEINGRFPALAEALLGDDAETCFPGGESFGEFSRRVSRFAGYLDRYTGDETIVIVGHGASLQTLICQILGVPTSLWRRFRVYRGSLSSIEKFPGGAVLTGLNDTHHLEED